MYKYSIVLVSFFFLFNSCKALDKLTQFTMEFDQTTTINATILIPIPIGSFSIPTPNITTNSESVFESNNTSKDLIEEAVLEVMTLKVTNPSDGNFNFLESLKVYIKADGLSEILIASKTTIEEGIALIELDSEGQNLEEYIKKDEIELRVETITDEILTRSYDIDIHTEFFIDAKILGV